MYCGITKSPHETINDIRSIVDLWDEIFKTLTFTHVSV